MNKEQFSYSKINSFNICPRKYEFLYIDYYPRSETNLIALKGTLLHKMIELYINDKDYDIPHDNDFLKIPLEEFELFKKDFETIKEQPLIKELKKMKNICEEVNVEAKLLNVFNDFIFSGYADTLIKNKNKIIIIDYKTGKVNQNFEQLEFYALISSYIYKDIEEFLLVLSFVSQKQDLKITIKKDDLLKIETKLLKFISNIKNSIKFSKKIGPLCNYCEYKIECEKKDKIDKIVEDILYSKRFLPNNNNGPLIYNGFLGAKTIILNDFPSKEDILNNKILSNDEGIFINNILNDYKIKLNSLFLLNYNFYVDNNYKEFQDVLKDLNKEQFDNIFNLINPDNIIIFGENLYKKFTNNDDFEHNSIKIYNNKKIYLFKDINTIIENFHEDICFDILNLLN